MAAGREERSRDQAAAGRGGVEGGAPYLGCGEVEQGGGGVGGREEGAPADCTDGLLQQVLGQGGAGGGEVHR